MEHDSPSVCIQHIDGVVLILILMEDCFATFPRNQIEIHFDLRGEMAATSTNEVSSLSQAHFDEILILMEHDSILLICSYQ